MLVAPLGQGGTASLLLQHHGVRVLLDCSAEPELAAAAPLPARAAGCAAAGLHLRVPHYEAALRDAAGCWQPLHAVLATSPFALLGLPQLRAVLRRAGQELPQALCTEACLHAFQQLSLELLHTQELLHAQQPSAWPPGAAPAASQRVLAQQQLQQLLAQRQRWAPQQAAAATSGGAPGQAASGWPGAAGAPPARPDPGRLEEQQQQQPAAPPPALLVPLFSPQQLREALDDLQVVRLGERVQLPGVFGLTVQAQPCGSGIGSALWQLDCGSQRAAYLSAASLHHGPSAPLHRPSFAALDALLLGPGSLCAPCALNPAADALPASARAAAEAVAAGGRVLVPVLPGGGAMLQLLEHLPAALDGIGLAGALAPLFYISPAAADVLATANSCCEYLEASRRAQVLAAGEAPFGHEQLLRSGRLRLCCAQAPPAPDAASGAACSSAAAALLAVGDGAAAPTAGLQDGGSGNAATAAAAALAWCQATLNEVLMVGACVAFVPLWSMAAGLGAMLASAWCSGPSNLLLLPEQVPLTAGWLQQCCELQLLPPASQQQWRVQYAPACSTAGACSSAHERPPPEGCLMPQQLLGLLADSSRHAQQQCRQLMPQPEPAQLKLQLLASAGDAQLLGLELGRTQDGPAAVTLVPLDTGRSASASRTAHELSFTRLDLPSPLLDVSLSKQLANIVTLQRLHISSRSAGADAGAPGSAAAAGGSGACEVSVARVRGLLMHKGGGWQLESLPSGTRPQTVAAVVEQQQQPQQPLLWGSVAVEALVADIQAAGLSVTSCAAGPEPGEHALIRVLQGDAEITLRPGGTDIVCDSWHVRERLLQCVRGQLHSVTGNHIA